MSNWKNKETSDLIKTISSIRTEKETKNFLRDLLTESELVEFGKRWQAAKMLDRGVSYIQISKTTGLSSTTVARISKWLTKGTGGYKTQIKNLKKDY